MMSFARTLPLVLLAAFCAPAVAAAPGAYPVVGTHQSVCTDAAGQIACPASGQPFFGQDAQTTHSGPAYRDNGDGTVSDLVTGLMWQKTPGAQTGWSRAKADAAGLTLGGYGDWRLPTIKELYSLIAFSGRVGADAAGSVPFIDTGVFDFQYGDTAAGQRFIDAQYWSSTHYVATTMAGNDTAFGVNFADGRIKGYPTSAIGLNGGRHFVRYVRGNPAYGVNAFEDQGDGTIVDSATGLMWAKADSGAGMDWRAALAWVQRKNQEGYLGHRDWRLPSAKELQSIVDYTRAPSATDPARRGAAIDPVFQSTALADGEYPYVWSATTHFEGTGAQNSGHGAVYLAFGRALGYMPAAPGSRTLVLLDVHGAGAQRSDPKIGDPAAYPQGHGPQGDVVRIANFVRLVRQPRY